MAKRTFRFRGVTSLTLQVQGDVPNLVIDQHRFLNHATVVFEGSDQRYLDQLTLEEDGRGLYVRHHAGFIDAHYDRIVWKPKRDPYTKRFARVVDTGASFTVKLWLPAKATVVLFSHVNV